MQSPYKRIVSWKLADVIMQLCSSLLILLFACCLPQLLFTGLFILGSLQVVSIMLWLYILDEEPNKLWLGLPVRFAFMLVVTVALASCCNHDMHFMAYLASITYPVLGPVYVLLTLAELKCYRKLQKKEPV